MARPPKWHGVVSASREEALNAVELYNRPAGRRPLEAFLVHMHIAWLYLLHAEFMRDKVNFHYRDRDRPTRYLRVDGEKKAWELAKCVENRWPNPGDPVRQNLDLTTRLRNKVEHRHEPGLRIMSVGFAQSLILNYEEELVAQFGQKWSVADVVHMPIALSTYTREGVAAMVRAQRSVPKRLHKLFIDYRNQLSPETRDDRRFEFRIEILQKRAPKSEADLAISFVREEDLADDERKAYEALERTGRVILREKERPVSNLGRLKPSAVCERVEAAIPFRFRHSSEFPAAWKALGVRPPGSARGRARAKTQEQYCLYDEPHDDYVYTQAYVDLLIERCQTEEGFRELIGWQPTLQQVKPIRAEASVDG